jgi:hypothetical protein
MPLQSGHLPSVVTKLGSPEKSVIVASRTEIVNKWQVSQLKFIYKTITENCGALLPHSVSDLKHIKLEIICLAVY